MTYIPRPPSTATVQASLGVSALQVVDALQARTEPEEVPEHLEGWNDAFITAIRELKDQFRRSPDLGPLLSIASDQLYGREIHWALELIQNAEDAGSRHITFVFTPNRVIVSNDGDPFTASDVWGVCSAGHSPKKNKIGFFGIGFKSVARITDAPEIHSGPYAFRILDKIYPEALPASELRRPGARFVLPVRRGDRPKLEGIIAQLTSPEFLHLLLTLRSLETIRVVDRVSNRGRGRFYRLVSAVSHRQEQDDCRIGGSWPGCEEQVWRRFRSSTDVTPAGLARQGRETAGGLTSVVVLARPLDREISTTKLHCFLPLDVMSELRWLIQADFDPTPGRERLRENEWNRWLLGQVGEAIAKAVEAEARAAGAVWPLVPLDAEVPTESMQRLAFETATRSLRARRFVRTSAGWRSPSATAFTADDAMRAIVREADLGASSGTRASVRRRRIETRRVHHR